MYKVINQARGLKLIDHLNNNNFHIVLSNYGASVYLIEMLDRNNRKEIITLTPQYAYYYNNSKYAGAIIGRVAGRIKNGDFKLNDKPYHVNTDGKKYLLHSCLSTSAFKLFDFKIDEIAEETKITFYLFTKDMEDGFPGDIELRVIYHLFMNENKMRIEIQAISSKDTVLNISSHIYFNLSGNLRRDILNHELTINKGYFYTCDANLIPVEKTVVTKEFDFRMPKLIGKDIYSDDVLFPTKGYDHLFTGSKPLDISLYDKESGRCVNIKSSYTDVTIYTNNQTDNYIYLGDVADSPHLGIAVEPNRLSKFYSPDGLTLKARTLYNHYIDYIFEIR